jgi:hypothetical protein
MNIEEKEIFRLVEQIALLKEYITYLHAAENTTIGFMHYHNWQYSPKLLSKGNELRAMIDPDNLPTREEEKAMEALCK